MPIIHEEPIGGNARCECTAALPWLALRDAEAVLTGAERTGDALAVGSARHAVDAARTRCAALVAELLLHALNDIDVSQFMARTVNRLDPIDTVARDHAAAVARAVEDHAHRHLRHQHELWELARAVARLEERLEILEVEGALHAA